MVVASGAIIPIFIRAVVLELKKVVEVPDNITLPVISSFSRGEVVPIPTFPSLFTTNSVWSDPPPAEVEAIAKSDAKLVVDVACTERSAKGEVVPTPS